MDRERINREYEQRQRADAPTQQRRNRSFGYQFWHRLWNAIFCGVVGGVFYGFIGAWLSMCLWDRVAPGAIAGVAGAVLYGTSNR